MTWFYRVWAVALLGFFGWSSVSGYRMGSAPKEHVPASVRSSPGGYRSYHFWHSGFSGGK